MIPLICKARTETIEGKWTNKMGGAMEEGDPTITKFYFEGRADIKELGGHLRIFFKDIIIKPRLFVLTELLRAKLLTDFYEERKKKRLAAYNFNPAIALEESDSDEEEDVKKQKEEKILEELVAVEKSKPLELPKFSLYLTSKKPKVRMVDAHTHGTKIRITGVNEADSTFGNQFAPSYLEASLTDIPDALSYQGIVILKLPEHEPVTDEPLIYGIVKLQSYRSLKIRTGDALGLTEISETLTKILAQRSKHAEGETAAEAKAKKEAEKKKAKEKAAAAAAGAVDNTIIDDEAAQLAEAESAFKSVADRVKPLHVYRQQANKVWLDFQKTADVEVDFETFLRFVDHLGIFMVTTQARRIFDAVNQKKDGLIGLSEFENFLIANDILGESGLDLIVLDVFDSMKTLPLALIAKHKEKEEKKLATIVELKKQQKLVEDLKEALNAAAIAGTGTEDEDGPIAAKENLASSVNAKLATDLAVASTTVAALQASLAASAAKDVVTDALTNNKRQKEMEPGLDYSAFNEAIQLLGVKEEDDDVLREAFCFGGSFREKDADKKYLNLVEFRKAWLKLADVETEMTNRGLKYDAGVFAESRNRERLTRALSDVEDLYLTNLAKINHFVDRVKQDRRQKKDQRRKDLDAHREKLLHEAKKFMAVRSMEKRLKLKREQEEKSKKRLEDKVLKNKLLLRQEENAALQRLNIVEANKKSEKLRNDEIRALGWDQIDLSVQKLKFIPTTLYTGLESQTRLGYALSADFSHNVLEVLPGKDFLYWCSGLRVLKLAENRLKTLPADIEKLLNLEILELNANRLESIPEAMSMLTSLQRLDLSNNQLEMLPVSLGGCFSLRYLCLHSNMFTMIPKSIGDCGKLEYLDISRNKLLELPETMQNMGSLTHLDISSNRITGFPYHIGDCGDLAYINASTNAITYIPQSFSKLHKLEYCNLENNEIVTTSNCFNQLTSLRYLSLRVNNARSLYADMGNMRNLTLLDLSVNAITALPLEMGMLSSLQELRLHRNQLVTLPPELGSCAMLQKLEISNNSLIGCLPDTIGLVTSLVHLDISFNQISVLPRSIVGLQQLVSIFAERCLLTSLPDTVTYLDRLEVIQSLIIYI